MEEGRRELVGAPHSRPFPVCQELASPTCFLPSSQHCMSMISKTFSSHFASPAIAPRTRWGEFKWPDLQLRKLRPGRQGCPAFLVLQCQNTPGPQPRPDAPWPAPLSSRRPPEWTQATGTAPQGSRGFKRGLLGRAREGQRWGLGQGPGRKAPSPDWNKVAAPGAQPGFIDLARCSSHRAGPAPGRLPVFPGVGTPWGNGLSCGGGVGMPPSTWGRPGRRGHAGSGCVGLGVGGWARGHGIPQPASVRPPETASWPPGSETLRMSASLSSEPPGVERSLCARHSAEPFICVYSLQLLSTPESGFRHHPISSWETKAQQG